MTKFKRSAALIGSVMVLLCCLSSPVMAYDVLYDPGDGLRPLWNLSRVEVQYGDGGEVAVFEFPDDWFTNSEAISNVTIVYDDPNGDPHSLQFTSITHPSFETGIYGVAFRFSSYNATSMTLFFDDVIIPYTDLGGENMNFRPVQIQMDGVTTDGRFNFGYGAFEYDPDGVTVIGRRYASYGLTSIDNLHEENDGPPTIEGDPVEGNYWCATPNNDWIHFLAGYSPTLDYAGGLSGKYLHFFDMSCTATITNRSSLDVFIPLVKMDTYVSFYDYIRSVFPGYRIDISTEGYSQLGDFLAGTLHGFINFQIMPGISIGDLFMAVIGISLVILLVKYFAGG